MASLAEEEAIIRKRYLTQTVATVATAFPPFKKLVKSYMHFSKALEGGSLEEAEKIYPDLLADLYAVQFLSQKLEAAGGAFRSEQQAYAEKQAQLQASIQQAERDIGERKAELVEARQELVHKQEYEAVRKQIMQVPARSATLAEQGATQREIADLQQQSAALDALFVRRKQQFAWVLTALEQLQRSIDQDAPEEGGALPPPPPPPPAQEGASGGAAVGAAGGSAAAAPQRQAMQVG